MTPEDWHKGMDNEAASVDDATWAAQARRAAWFQRGPRVMLVLGAALLLYILVSSGLVMAFNALSIGYGSQLMRPLILGSPLPWVLTVLLVPFLAAVLLARLGLRPALVWMVPALGTLLETLVASMVTVAVPLNLSETFGADPIDLLPSVNPDLGQVLSVLLLKALAVGLGLWLGQRSLRDNIKAGQAGLKR
jgi:hypothetical protein